MNAFIAEQHKEACTTCFAKKIKLMPARRVLTQRPIELAVAFSTVVTVQSDNPGDWVARNGDESIFAILSKLLAEVI